MPICSNPFEGLPDLRAQADITSWLAEEVDRIRSLEINAPDTFEVVSFQLHDFYSMHQFSDDQNLNKFLLAVILADWSCYADQENREDYACLKNVFAVSPQGFRLYMTKFEGKFIPIGYTGLHPNSQDTFVRIKKRPDSITNRMQITPESESIPGQNYYYIYNLGIINQFQRSAASKMLVKAFAKDLAATNACGLAAIVVSPDGQRVIEKFGLRQSGFITHDGHKEIAYVREDSSVSQDV